MSSFTPVKPRSQQSSYLSFDEILNPAPEKKTQSTTSNSAMAQPTVKKHLCTVENCERRFQYPKDLRRHMATHTGEKSYLCDIGACHKAFTRKDNLDRHKNNDH